MKTNKAVAAQKSKYLMFISIIFLNAGIAQVASAAPTGTLHCEGDVEFGFNTKQPFIKFDQPLTLPDNYDKGVYNLLDAKTKVVTAIDPISGFEFELTVKSVLTITNVMSASAPKLMRDYITFMSVIFKNGANGVLLKAVGSAIDPKLGTNPTAKAKIDNFVVAPMTSKGTFDFYKAKGFNFECSIELH